MMTGYKKLKLIVWLFLLVASLVGCTAPAGSSPQTSTPTIRSVSTYEPLGDDIPFAVTPDPTVHFPQLRTRSAAFMEALLQGKLAVTEGCLRVTGSGRSHLVIWQPDFFVNNNEGVIEILDRNGEVVARVGEEIRIGGGEVPLTEKLKQLLREPLPEQCRGPNWSMGELVSSE